MLCISVEALRKPQGIEGSRADSPKKRVIAWGRVFRQAAEGRVGTRTAHVVSLTSLISHQDTVVLLSGLRSAFLLKIVSLLDLISSSLVLNSNVLCVSILQVGGKA